MVVAFSNFGSIASVATNAGHMYRCAVLFEKVSAAARERLVPAWWSLLAASASLGLGVKGEREDEIALSLLRKSCAVTPRTGVTSTNGAEGTKTDDGAPRGETERPEFAVLPFLLSAAFLHSDEGRDALQASPSLVAAAFRRRCSRLLFHRLLLRRPPRALATGTAAAASVPIVAEALLRCVDASKTVEGAAFASRYNGGKGKKEEGG